MDGLVSGFVVDLQAAVVNSHSSIAWGNITLDGTATTVAVEMAYVSGESWTVTAAFYVQVLGYNLQVGQVNGTLVYTGWGSSSSPLRGWELRNATTKLTLTGQTAYSTSSLPLSLDLDIGDSIYYYSDLSQSSGTNYVTEYLEVDDESTSSGFLNGGSVGAISQSLQVSSFDVGSTGASYYNGSGYGSSISYAATESWLSPTLQRDRSTSVTRTGTTLRTVDTNLSTRVATTTTSSSRVTTALSYTAPTTWSGSASTLLAPL